MPKITERMVNSIRPDRGGRGVFVWDSGYGVIEGFGVRVKPSGMALYFAQYRTTKSHTRSLAIGNVPTPDGQGPRRATS
jgi:hypothetical protein